MPDWSLDDVALLSSKLQHDDAERGLRDGLNLLAERGIVLAADEQAKPWLRLERGPRRLVLSTSANFDESAHASIAGLLALALARAVEQQEHRRTEERLQMLSEASFEGILVHNNGVVIDANLRMAEILRADGESLLGPETMQTCVAAEDMANVLARMASGFEGAYVITGVRKDGSRFRAELQSKQGRLGDQPVRVVAVRDVTERERTLAMLRESEARLRELADTVFDLTVLSREGTVVEVRGRLEEILGYRPEQVVGRPLLDFVAPSALPISKQVVQEKRVGAYESLIVSASGKLIPFEIVGTYSSFDGKPTRVAGLRDLRDAQRLADERRTLERQVERAQRLESLGVLAGGIAHDFNNILVGVLGNADLLLSTTLLPMQRELVEAVLAAGRKAAALTAQMLAYAGRSRMTTPEPVDLVTLVTELKVLLSATLSKKAELVFDLHPDSLVIGDRTTLAQVLINLLTNASDALQGEVGRIEVRTRLVQQPEAHWDQALGAAVKPGPWVLIEVEDTGVGMDAATQEHIFDPFFTTKPKGHGLGLAASVGILASHGGALHVQSQPGQGSCFSLLLPRAHAAVPTLAEAAPTSAPCRILVVDDEGLVRGQLRRSLELRGFVVFEAEDGRSALALLNQTSVDLLIVDMTMGDLDGPELIREIRISGLDMPIVLTSGYIDASAEKRLDPTSFQAFLKKPFGIAELMRSIEQAQATARVS